MTHGAKLRRRIKLSILESSSAGNFMPRKRAIRRQNDSGVAQNVSKSIIIVRSGQHRMTLVIRRCAAHQ
jgi:hypothetical protein